MTLQPRYILRTLAALVAVALLSSLSSGGRTPASGRASARLKSARHESEREREARLGAGPRDRFRNEPVGRDRVVVPQVPGPIAAGNGAVYVPRALAEIPF